MILIERFTESLPDLDTALGLRGRSADEPASNALVTALIMVVLHELIDRMVERPLTKDSHPADTLGLDRPGESLGVYAFMCRVVRPCETLQLLK